MIRIVLALGLVATLTAGCTGTPAPSPTGSGTSAVPSTTPSPTSTTSTPTSSATPTATLPPAPVNAPLLGSGPVLAVKIDNTTSARPRIGVDSADIVYVEPVEAGLTRLLAIYASALPPEVGPVRSARESDAVLLGNYGHVAFAFSGGSPITLSAIASGPQVNVSMDSGGAGYHRVSNRKAPYNVIGTPTALLARAGRSVPAGDIGFHTGPAPAGGRAATSLATAYPFARISFAWDASLGRYRLTTDGRAEVTAAGTPVAAATVLVQMVRTHLSTNRDINGVFTPVLELVGTGEAKVLRDGSVFDGTWSRSSATSPTRLTGASGSELTLSTGPLWVLLVPVGQGVSIS